MNHTIFGTEMMVSTFIILCVEVIFFVVHVPILAARVNDKSRWRFSLLTLLFIFYNLSSGLLPDYTFSLSELLQNILAYGSGIVLASYFFYFLIVELNLSQKRFFNLKLLFFSLVISFIVGYIFTFIITGNTYLAKRIFIGFPVLISVYFCLQTIQILLKKKITHSTEKLPYNSMLRSGYIGIIFMATMPIIVFFGDYQTLNNGLVNLSFFLVAYSYFKSLSYHVKMEYAMLNKIGYFDNTRSGDDNEQNLLSSKLTKRELEIAFMVLQGLNYGNIGNDMNIANKTVSKHASNIFKKTNCDNRKEFILKFGNSKE